MSFDLKRILEDKRRLRSDLAARSIEEKLRILDALRERELAIRGQVPPSPPTPLPSDGREAGGEG